MSIPITPVTTIGIFARVLTWLSRLLLVAVVVAVLMVAFAPAARAADGGSVVTFSLPWPMILGLLVAVVSPLIVGLVTKIRTSSGLRAVLLALVAAITGLGTELLEAITSGTPYDLGLGVIQALAAFLIAVGMHFGIYKPTGASDAVKAVGDRSVIR